MPAMIIAVLIRTLREILSRFADFNASPFQLLLSICLGNWGSAICRIVGDNAKSRDEFADEVRMWVFEEEVDGRKLTEIINTDHENVKYLPGTWITIPY